MEKLRHRELKTLAPGSLVTERQRQDLNLFLPAPGLRSEPRVGLQRTDERLNHFKRSGFELSQSALFWPT